MKFLSKAKSTFLNVLFPSRLINKWAKNKSQQIQNPTIKNLVEGLTYDKIYHLDSIKNFFNKNNNEKSLQKKFIFSELAGENPINKLNQEIKKDPNHNPDIEFKPFEDDEIFKNAQLNFSNMLQRKNITPNEVEQGLKSLKTEIIICRIGVILSIILFFLSIFLWGGFSLIMSTIALCLSYVKGTVAGFYYFQTQNKALVPFFYYIKRDGWAYMWLI